MSSRKISEIVNGILEGQSISDFLTNPLNTTIEGSKLIGSKCPHCEAENSLIVMKVLSEDQNFYNVTAKCAECDEISELELVLREEDVINKTEEGISFDGQIFAPVFEGIMTGNYLKFNNGTKCYLSKTDTGDNLITFEPVGDGPEKLLNTRVTFKIISFRNGLAKIISMVNDNANKLPAGTIFFVDKGDLQKQAKISAPKQNASMAGKFKV